MSPPSEPVIQLSRALGTDPPEGVVALDDEDVAELARMVQRARLAQQESIETAVDHALRLVPWPLRKVVKRVIRP